MSARSIRELGSLAYRHVCAVAGGISGSTSRTLDAQRGNALILMYHRILPDDHDVAGIEPGMYVRASVFDRQLAWIRRRWQILTLGDAIDRPAAPDAEPIVVLTFDDGWRDNLTVAWPLMKRHGVRATIFLVRDWVAAGHNGEDRFMTPAEVRELADQGVEFGAHTVSHPHLDRLNDPAAEDEMLLSKHSVEEWAGKPCRLFAYPYGSHNEQTAVIARKIFEGTARVGGGWWGPDTDPARLPRVGIHQDMTSTKWIFESRLAAQA